MRRYGPLRNLWEGGWNGEGFIGIMKPEMKNGMQRNWQCNLTSRVVQKKAYENVLGITGEETTAVEDTKRAMRTYDCGFAMENKFKRGLPLSVVEVEDRYGTKFGCVIGNDRFVPLRIVKYQKQLPDWRIINGKLGALQRIPKKAWQHVWIGTR
jgi:hypothetical protein